MASKNAPHDGNRNRTNSIKIITLIHLWHVFFLPSLVSRLNFRSSQLECACLEMPFYAVFKRRKQMRFYRHVSGLSVNIVCGVSTRQLYAVQTVCAGYTNATKRKTKTKKKKLNCILKRQAATRAARKKTKLKCINAWVLANSSVSHSADSNSGLADNLGAMSHMIIIIDLRRVVKPTRWMRRSRMQVSHTHMHAHTTCAMQQSQSTRF